jgi:uncharacterized membrane-anchored protein
MKKNLLIITLIFPIFLATTLSVQATTNSWGNRMLQRQKKAMPEAIRSYIQVWAAGKDKLAYAEPLQRILRGQTLLLSYDVDIDDDLMVAHLFEDNGKPVSYSLFGARLFFHEFKKETGWLPDRRAPLKNREYLLTVKRTKTNPGKNQFHLQTR